LSDEIILEYTEYHNCDYKNLFLSVNGWNTKICDSFSCNGRCVEIEKCPYIHDVDFVILKNEVDSTKRTEKDTFHQKNRKNIVLKSKKVLLKKRKVVQSKSMIM